MAKKVKVLRVISKRDGFRRAGMEFGSVPKNIPLGSIPSDAYQAIRHDPTLVSYEVVMLKDEHGNLSDLPTIDVEDLEQREEALKARAAELDKSVVEQLASRDQLDIRSKALDERTAEADAREAVLNALAADLGKREAQLAEREAAHAHHAGKPKTGGKQG